MKIKPSDKYIGILRLRLAVIAAVILFICGNYIGFNHIPTLILSVGIFALFWAWYIPRFVRSHEVTLGEDAIIVKVGVFIKRQHIIPDKRCVYCRKISGPITRAFGVASIQIKTIHGIVTIFGIDEKQADFLILRGGR